MEIEGIANPRQRRHIAEVMEELTHFRTLLSRASIMRLEVEAALDDLVGPPPRPLYPGGPTHRPRRLPRLWIAGWSAIYNDSGL